MKKITKVQNLASEKINMSIQCCFNITNIINYIYMNVLEGLRFCFGMRDEGFLIF